MLTESRSMVLEASAKSTQFIKKTVKSLAWRPLPNAHLLQAWPTPKPSKLHSSSASNISPNPQHTGNFKLQEPKKPLPGDWHSKPVNTSLLAPGAMRCWQSCLYNTWEREGTQHKPCKRQVTPRVIISVNLLKFHIGSGVKQLRSSWSVSEFMLHFQHYVLSPVFAQ